MGHALDTYLDRVRQPLNTGPRTFLSVDVEDYYHFIPGGEDWFERGGIPSQLESNLDRLLDHMAAHGFKCTFFVLSCVAPRIGAQLRRMVEDGHEVASHGHGHLPITQQSPRAFLEDVRLSKEILEQAAGVEVVGYRAPMFTVVDRTLWALDILHDLGFRYDSSVAPVSNFMYGIPEAPHHPHFLSNGMLELPLSTFSLLRRPMMLGGGFYLRLYPLWLHRLLLRMRDAALPTILYIHPWELSERRMNPWDMDIEHEQLHERPRLWKWIYVHNRRAAFDRLSALMKDAGQTHTLGSALEHVPV